MIAHGLIKKFFFIYLEGKVECACLKTVSIIFENIKSCG